MNPRPVSFFFYLTGKPGLEAELRQLLTEMTLTSRGEPGCVHYLYHQDREDPQQWLLYEQWRDKTALEAHVANMVQAFGAPPPGAQLPARLHALTQSSRYTVARILC